MSFELCTDVDSSKVFIERKTNVTGRWDPFFYRPEFVDLEKRVGEVTSQRLRDFALSMAGGATPSTKEAEEHYDTTVEEGVPFIRVQNLSTTGELNLEDIKLITRSTHEGLLKRSRLEGGELLVKITGVGRMAVASVVPEGFEGNINQHIVAIRTDSIRTSRALAAYLNLDFAEKLASRRATGGTRPALDYPALLSIPIILDERIPKMLHKAIKYHKEKLIQAKSLLASIDDLLLTELGIPNPPEPSYTLESRIFQTPFPSLTGQRWDPLYHQADIFNFVGSAPCGLHRLSELTDYLLTGFAAGRGDQVDGEDDGVIQIRPTNLSEDREFVFKRNVYIAASELETRKSDILRRNEVLFNNTNSQEQVGKSVCFELEGSFFCSNHVTRIGTNSSALDASYLTYILNLYQRRKVFFKLCTNWNNQSGVGNDVLARLLIPVPSVKRQREIVSKLESVRTQARSLRSQAQADLEQAKRDIEAIILGEPMEAAADRTTHEDVNQ